MQFAVSGVDMKRDSEWRIGLRKGSGAKMPRPKSAQRRILFTMKTVTPPSIITALALGAFSLSALAQNAAPGTGPGTSTGAGGGARTGSTQTDSNTTGLGTAATGTTSGYSAASLDALFRRLDTNGDGSVSRSEFMTGRAELEVAASSGLGAAAARPAAGRSGTPGPAATTTATGVGSSGAGSGTTGSGAGDLAPTPAAPGASGTRPK